MKTRIIAAVGAFVIAATLLTGCTQTSQSVSQRDELQSQNREESLEIKNLEKKRQLEEDPAAVRYVYLIDFGTIIGYYVAEGKISSNSSQIAPEQDLIKGWESVGEGEDLYVVDSAKDDGSFGPGDPGVFFFTTEGAMVETDLKTLISTVPIPIDVPRLTQ